MLKYCPYCNEKIEEYVSQNKSMFYCDKCNKVINKNEILSSKKDMGNWRIKCPLCNSKDIFEIFKTFNVIHGASGDISENNTNKNKIYLYCTNCGCFGLQETFLHNKDKVCIK